MLNENLLLAILFLTTLLIYTSDQFLMLFNPVFGKHYVLSSKPAESLSLDKVCYRSV